MLDTQLQGSLAPIPDGADKTEGVSAGQKVADGILALRSNDGSSAQPIPYVFGSASGNYQSTPPNFPKQPQFTHWSHVTPFALETAHRFRPGPPPALTSATYSDAFNEIKAFGITNSSASSAELALTGHFWNGAIQNYWNEVTQTSASAHHLTTPQSARLFALLNLTFADSVIAFYDAKYTYNFWRPVTAVRAADTDNNPETVADPNWLPEAGNTGPDPSYPGAPAVVCCARGAGLDFVFQRRPFHLSVTFEGFPRAERASHTVSPY